MRFSWTLKELQVLRGSLIDAQYFHSDLQERLEENGEEKTDRFKQSKASEKNAEALGTKVLAEILRRQSESRHRRKAVSR